MCPLTQPPPTTLIIIRWWLWMSETKTKLNPENVLKEDFVKPNGLEIVIVPKNQFLEWFKYMKGRKWT